jgi:hypothetical protein
VSDDELRGELPESFATAGGKSLLITLVAVALAIAITAVIGRLLEHGWPAP